jgi:hypothetical protein
MRQQRLLRALIALPWLALLASACVRIGEPEEFSCSSDADCASDERCSSAQVCVERGKCQRWEDCGLNQGCAKQRCVPAECVFSSYAECGAYACNPNTKICFTSCSDNSQCDSYCMDGRCSTFP